MGRIATIVFAARLGTSLEPECKLYRLLVCMCSETFSRGLIPLFATLHMVLSHT
jgi:hypothetical protein